ncbi:aldo/keto reductase [Cryobacterium tagatosivorans]|uniref:aldo/keto reductase n=1 Tax=Cryobacterium tagatosivorans TaxID=1259199 RepID=UPI001F542A14|nr:aldo/keto reductase [Cryobacterium tagatosivorans]
MGPPPISAPVPVQSVPATGPVETGRDTPVRRRIADTDLLVHPLALGGSVFGWTIDGSAAMRVLDRHRDLGGNFVDTADSYAAGRSEVIIGSWLRSRGARDDTVIATKIGRNRDHPGLSAASITGAVQASLERLGTDHIDLLYFHLDDPDVPLEESLGAVDALIRRGQVRYLAASNFTAERLMEARVLSANGLPRFVALETHYNLVHREPFESSLALPTHAQGMAVLPYFALAHGFLAGRYRTRADATGTARAGRAAAYLNRNGLRVLGVVDRIAVDHGVPPATIALAWLLARDGTFVPVAGASLPEQVDALVAAAGIRLGRGEMVELDRVSVAPGPATGPRR